MLDRRIRKKIEWAFRNYETLKAQAAEYLVELAESGLTANYDAVGGHIGVGNPTEQKGIKVAEQTAYEWCMVVEKTLEHFRGTEKDALIRLRYFERLSANRVEDRLYIDRSTQYRWIDEILTYAVMVALQLQLLKVF